MPLLQSHRTQSKSDTQNKKFKKKGLKGAGVLLLCLGNYILYYLNLKLMRKSFFPLYSGVVKVCVCVGFYHCMFFRKRKLS